MTWLPAIYTVRRYKRFTKYSVDIWKREVVIIQRQGIILVDAEV